MRERGVSWMDTPKVVFDKKDFSGQPDEVTIGYIMK
jgi:hypothetical protein